MSQIDWSRAKQLVAEALDLQANERQAFLARLHAEDATIGREVETLLSAHEQAESAGFLEGLGSFHGGDAPAAGPAKDEPPRSASPADDDTIDSDVHLVEPGAELTLIDSRAGQEPPPDPPVPKKTGEKPGRSTRDEIKARMAAETVVMEATESPPPAPRSEDAAHPEQTASDVKLDEDQTIAQDAPGGGRTLPAGDVIPPPPPPGASRRSGSFPRVVADDIDGQPELIADDFEVKEEIGVGGMGIVYRAYQHSLRREVALKIIPTRMLRHAEQVARFYVEAEAAGRLDHPGIVPVQSVGEHGGVHYYAMALVEGGSLAQYVSKTSSVSQGAAAKSAKERIPTRRAAEIVEQVARAVQYAHDRAVIHRDIKPANILLDKQGRPRLTDFGLAKVTDDDDGLTVTGQVMGTPSYMAPEQADGNNLAISNRTDVYSLGATLYALLAGKPPFVGETLYATIRKVKNTEPPPLGSETPLDLATICTKCLAKRPDDRYESAAALANDLRRYLDGFPIAARRLSPWQRVDRWRRRNPVVASLVGVVAATLLVATIVSTAFGIRASQNAAQARTAQADAEATAERLSAMIEETFIFASEDILAETPGMQAARQKLLDTAQRYYQQLAESGYGDQTKQAAAAFMLGRVQASLGKVNEAARSFDGAIHLQEAAIEHQPGDANLMMALAQSHNEFARLGQSMWHGGQIDRPTEETRDALAMWIGHSRECEKWRSVAAEAKPGDAEILRLHANALMNLALARIEQTIADSTADTSTEIDAIERLLTKAQTIRDALLKEDPASGEVIRDYALGLAAMADLRALEAQRAAAELPPGAALPMDHPARELWQKSLELTQQAAQRFVDLPPESRSPQSDFNLATCYQHAGQRCYLLGEVDTAIEDYDRMLAVSSELLRQNPRVRNYRLAVAEAQLNLAMLAYGSDDLDGGATLIADCQDTLVDGVALDPASSFLGLLVDHTTAIAEALALNDQVSRPVQIELLERATGTIERAQTLLASLRVASNYAADIESARGQLQATADRLARQVKPDRGA